MKKPVTKDHIFHDSMYVKCAEQATQLLGAGGGGQGRPKGAGRQGVITKRYQGLGGDAGVINLIMVMTAPLSIY